jgi:tetratricopeptide (TPR) repeat protein
LDEAKIEMHRALDLDPLSLIIMADLGQVHYFAHEYDQAIDYCNRALILDSNFYVAHEYLVDIYRMKGMDQEALNELSKAYPSSNLEKLREVFAREGWRGIYKPEIEYLLVSKENGRPLALARDYSRIGDNNQALRWLDESIDKPRWFWQPYVTVDPLYDALRADPRFKQIVHRMEL